ncbi:MAG: ribosome silencing factor [Gammaproteobacteria bacterium]|nr:ribosome silencing factor [Gammaproteobacteria bacterium]
MNSEQLKDAAVAALEDVKGQDIRVLDIRDLTTIADYMIVVTGTSPRQVRALAERVDEAARGLGCKALGCEGLENCEWVLLDLGDVIVHAMQPATREFYQLEKLWEMPARPARVERTAAPE